MNQKVSLFLLLFSAYFPSAAQQRQSLDMRMLRYINHPDSVNDQKWRLVSNSLIVVAFATPVSMAVAGAAGHNNGLEIKGLETGVSLAVTAAVTYSLKVIVKRKRPYIEYPDLIKGKSVESTYSFPSSHTSIAFATATALSLSFPKWYVITPAYSYALLVAYSRSYLGVHYPGDILGGAIVGAGTSFLTWKLQRLVRFGVKIPVK